MHDLNSEIYLNMMNKHTTPKLHAVGWCVCGIVWYVHGTIDNMAVENVLA